MDSKVYIIHSYAIVQKGLADILRKNFNCSIFCFNNLSEFQQAEEISSGKVIFFVEEAIANGEEYLQFIEQLNEVSSFCLINGPHSVPQNSGFNLYLHHTADEIYERVKEAFMQQDLSEDENVDLTNREIDVLKLVALGFSNKEIADKLFISTHTVISHRKNMTEKLGIKSISGLTVYAIINNFIDTTNLNVKDLI